MGKGECTTSAPLPSMEAISAASGVPWSLVGTAAVEDDEQVDGLNFSER